MSEGVAVIPEPEDYKDRGPMPSYDNPNKPICTRKPTPTGA